MDKAHFVDPKFIRFLEDFNVSNRLPGERREPNVQQDVTEMCIDVVKEGIKGGSFVVGKTEATRFGGGAFILCAPRSTVLLGVDQRVDWTEGSDRRRTPELDEELAEVRVKSRGKDVCA